MPRFFYSVSFAALLLSTGMFPGLAHAQEPLQARAEVNWRYGSERSILMSEFWVPLAQDENGVLYGDYRMMGDDQDNREFNAGLGYREIVTAPVLGKGVAGVHSWFDRRHTERGSTFNQVTAGVEWYGEEIDLKLNGYFPLNDKQTHNQTNPNGAGTGFAGNQIVINTDQLVVEEALAGLDLELGYNVPFMAEYTDSTRVYGGVYHFEGDKAENVSGWRTRVAADVTSDIEIGSRFQRDDVRGSQSFLEATVRFPLRQKKSYRSEGLRARLDESPERDIDIVSNETITDDGNNKTLLNAATGGVQNVIHVNNTSGAGGDGSAENPYNTLTAAQTAASANDIIYIHLGDGTTTGQNAGITLNGKGQMLAGSGSSLSFDSARFVTSNRQSLSSNTIIPADPNGAPTITNSAGDGVTIAADNIKVSGITVDGADGAGIIALNNSGTSWESAEISNVSALNNNEAGISIHSSGSGSTIENANIYGSLADNNAQSANEAGITIIASNAGKVTNAIVKSSTATNNTWDGVRIWVRNPGSVLENILVENTTVSNNTTQGTQIYAQLSGYADTAIFRDITAINNGSDNLLMFSPAAIINDVTIEDVYSDQSGRHGIWIYTYNDGAINSAFLNNITSSNSVQDGIQIYARDTANIENLRLGNTLATGNGSNGAFVRDDTTDTFLVDIGGGILGSEGKNSLYGNTTKDLRVDLDGRELKAENNWWGVSTGLAGGQVTLDGGSTIDADPYLTEAP